MFEIVFALPTERAQLIRLHSITTVMPLAIRHVLDQIRRFAQPIEQHMGDIDVVAQILARDVVGFARLALVQRRIDPGHMIMDKEPVAHLLAITIDGQRAIVDGLSDEQRQHLVPEDSDELLLDMLADMSAEDAATIKELLKQQKYKEFDMASVDQTLHAIMNIEGAIATALVDWDSGLTLGTAGSGIDIDLAAAGNTNVVRAKLAVMKDLGLKGGIEDILITLTGQYHLIRILHDSKASLFLYVVLDRNHSNLGMARHKLAAIESDLNV